ncbi:uncharacterized protein LOC113360793 [Papaver somniferum]|uniref:uncharacterized protein LOC113360793 n=1 Tax=Papaver somniferum TaxID=3469 RepID=UPI000E6FB777|nr:uncharacterized protein LOC113360793 [Papaver somniferum]
MTLNWRWGSFQVKWKKTFRKNCFQEWGFHKLESELQDFSNSNDTTADADDVVPSINLDLETRKCIILPWKHCLIGKVVGKTVGFKYLSFKINELWKLKVTSNAGNVEDSYGPWMIVENKKSKSKGSLTNGQGIRTNGGKEETANRFSSLPEQQSVDVDGNGEKKEEAFNAKFSNRNADNDVVRDGNSKIFGRKLHSREMNANSGSPTNGVLLQTTQGKNMNRKCNFPTNEVSIGDINDEQSVAKDSRNKGKGIMISGPIQSNRRIDGAQQSDATPSLTGNSKPIGSFMECGRPASPQSSRGASSHAKSPDRNSDREYFTDGLKVTNNGGHSAHEKAYESSTARDSTCSRTTELGYSF